MRKLDNNRIEGFVKKHTHLKRWISVMLVVALLVTTATMYSLNKSANALSDEDAEDVGMVLSGNDSDDLAAEGGDEGDTDSVQDSGDADSTDGESTDNADTDEGTSSDADVKEDGNSDVTSDEDTDSTDNSETESTDGTSEGENSDGTTDLADASDNQTTEDGENTDAPNSSEGLKDTNDVDLTQDVVLTVSYVTEDNEQIADEKEISLSESLDFETEAPKQEGYEFKQASIDETVISKIVAKQDANGYKYYEVNTADGTALTVKEDKTVVLTYSHEIVVDGGVKLTAKYVDKDGAEIKEAEDFVIAEETDLKQGESTTLDGYFYLGATYNDQKITKITPVLEDSSEDSEKTEETEQAEGSEQTEETENRENKVVVKEYKATVTDSEDITISEDSDIVFTYVKATTETSFSYSDDKVIVTAEATAEGVFPEGIELKVTELNSQTENYNYDAYLNALNDNADAIAKDAGKDESCQYSESNTILYDIAFMYEGKEIQPKEGLVNVSIQFKENQLSDSLSASQEDISVVHLPIKDEVKEANSLESTEEAKEITSEDIEVKTLTEATAEVGDDEKVEFSEDNFSIYAVIAYQNHTPGTDTFKSVLGDAVNFGLTTYQIFVNESETNFAAKVVYANAQTGNDMTNSVEQTFIAASIIGNFNLKGEKAYFMVPEQYKNNVGHEKGAEYIKLDTTHTQADLENTVEGMMTYVRNASADLATRTANASIVKDANRNERYYVDTTSYAAGTYYVTVSESDLANIGAAEKLTIKKNPDQTIVFNVMPSGEIKLHKFMVETNGETVGSDTLAGRKEDSIARTIIWNFPNASTVRSSDGVVGVFISGQQYASWENDSTSAGWISFPSIKITSEFHNTYDEVQQISGTAQFQTYKNVDGQASTVKGFGFTLYKKDSTGTNGWTEVETVKNDEDPHVVTFNPITFGNEADKKNRSNYQYTTIGEGQSTDFVYKIAETQGSADDSAKAYSADRTIYYAKVTVTCQKLNEYTNTMYYRVSAPSYYTDENCTNAVNGIPTFNNTTSRGSVGLILHKYLNGGDPGNNKFKFTVKVVKSNGSVETLTDSLENDGSTIQFTFDYNNNYIYDGCIYFAISENDVADSSITKDEDYIIARVENPGTENQKVVYFKYNHESESAFIKQLKNNYITSGNTNTLRNNVTKHMANALTDENTAFYNTGSGLLRIHKMVVNDFGSEFVRNKTNAALLQTIRFRITNVDTGSYIVFKGFVDTANRDRTSGEEAATEYPSGNVYKVTYNNNAQWTISGLPAGTYQVEEVADGLTLGYDYSSNSSYVITTNNLSRVTKYDVTVDSNNGVDGYGTGGQNLRKVYSIDLKNHYDVAPEAHVGGDIETVQVCNYYSIPVGPITITKNFTGGVWDSSKAFTFKIEAAGYKAWDTANKSVKLESQPMPENTTITIVGDGNNTRIADFGSVPFRFEGDYTYRITEVAGDTKGIKYDSAVYTVEIQVRKKYTQFNKTYNGDNMANPEKYSKHNLHTVHEDFFYLGADIYYRDQKGKTLAVCRLTLPENLDTFENAKYIFNAEYISGKITDVVFNNVLAGELTISKVWLDPTGQDNSKDRTSLDVYIYQRISGGEWKQYGTAYQLTADNSWTLTLEDIPLLDENGNKYEYCVKEDEKYLRDYSVTYKYGTTEYHALNGDGMPKYTMSADVNNNYGTVTITNQYVSGYALPSTGGTGKLPYVIVGLVMLLIGACGIFYVKRRKEE